MKSKESQLFVLAMEHRDLISSAVPTHLLSHAIVPTHFSVTR